MGRERQQVVRMGPFHFTVRRVLVNNEYEWSFRPHLAKRTYGVRFNHKIKAIAAAKAGMWLAGQQEYKDYERNKEIREARRGYDRAE